MLLCRLGALLLHLVVITFSGSHMLSSNEISALLNFASAISHLISVLETCSFRSANSKCSALLKKFIDYLVLVLKVFSTIFTFSSHFSFLTNYFFSLLLKLHLNLIASYFVQLIFSVLSEISLFISLVFK